MTRLRSASHSPIRFVTRIAKTNIGYMNTPPIIFLSDIPMLIPQIQFRSLLQPRNLHGVLDAAICASPGWKERASPWQHHKRQLPPRRFCCVHHGAMLLLHSTIPCQYGWWWLPDKRCASLASASCFALEANMPTAKPPTRKASINNSSRCNHTAACSRANGRQVMYLANTPFPSQR